MPRLNCTPIDRQLRRPELPTDLSEETVMRKNIFPRRIPLLMGVLAVAAVAFTGHAQAQTAGPPDEAQQAGLTEASFPQAKEDYFRDMDNAAAMSAEEVQGRNMWLVWTGGQHRVRGRV